MIKWILSTYRKWSDKARYETLVDQGRHEGGITEEQGEWMRAYWLRTQS
jgi:hypothetical protein